jgi:hypothetical protein
MKATSILALGILTIAAGSAMADETASTSRPLTRVEVHQSVIAARDAGQLRPAGENGDNWVPRVDTHSTVSRSEVKHDVVVARSAGLLIPAGEAGDERIALAAERAAFNSDVRVTRAEVKAETLRARAAGELVPAGDAYGSGDVQQARAAVTANAYASARPSWLTAHASPVAR